MKVLELDDGRRMFVRCERPEDELLEARIDENGELTVKVQGRGSCGGVLVVVEE